MEIKNLNENLFCCLLAAFTRTVKGEKLERQWQGGEIRSKRSFWEEARDKYLALRID